LAQQQRVVDHRPDIPDFRGQHDKLRISPDAVTVGFDLGQCGRRPMRFAVDERRLSAGEAPGDLVTADVESLSVADWKNNPAPTLAGKPLKLWQHEKSASIAVAADRNSLLLGTSGNLRRFDALGAQTWSHPTPGAAGAVNLSRDGRLAVAAFNDGTIRWYRYFDGQELLALFVHRNGKRWVL
jgi:hypothetical protein